MTAALMDHEDVKTEWEKPSNNPMEGMTQEDIQKLLEYRSELLMKISEHYLALTKAIFELPIHVVFRQHAFLFLDTSEGWWKKGIDNVWSLPKKHEVTTPVIHSNSEGLSIDSVKIDFPEALA